MGLFWDLVQQSQIEDQKKDAESLEERVNNLETELERTKNLLIKTLRVLEESTNMDIDGDGKVGWLVNEVWCIVYGVWWKLVLLRYTPNYLLLIVY